MDNHVKVFFCERVGDEGISTESYFCKCGHSNRIEIGRFKESERPEFPSGKTIACAGCGNAVELSSTGFSFIYKRLDTGAELGGRDKLPPGAVYAYAAEYDYPKGSDGRSLVCVCPDGHHWSIDGRASNCTMKDDNVHRCWVRSGRPEDGTLHVDKNGNTCAAGAGSIQTSQWHGFLHNGELHT